MPRHLAAALLVACSSTSPVMTPPAAKSSTTTPILSCAKLDPAGTHGGDVDGEPIRPRPRAPGLFGRNLEPRETPDAGSVCQAARTTLDDTDAQILAAARPLPVAAGKPWDRKTDPLRWARVAQRYGFDDRHRARLVRDGFTVAESTETWNYVEAYHEIFQSQLPIYVSIDSVMHAIYASHNGVMGDVEQAVFAPKLKSLLSAMHCGMAIHAKAWPHEIAKDVDLYLTIARSLLDGRPVASTMGNDDQVAAWLGAIKQATGIRQVELFGRNRMVDFGMFKEHGRYEWGPQAQYFHAMTWLSKIELNLVSRGSRSSTMIVDQSETPREVAIGIALAELAKATQVLDQISLIDDAWGELAGRREDVSLAELARLAEAGHVGVSLAAQPVIAEKIGHRFRRAIPTEVMPNGVTDLPVIGAMFGARVTPDTAAIAPIIQPAVPQRTEISASDLGFLLGSNRAKAHLTHELATYPTLAKQLLVGRGQLQSRIGTDLYSLWLDSITRLGTNTVEDGVVPSFIRSEVYADLRLDSTIAAYGQLRESYALMTGMAYLGSGCEIPDGYVEPAADVYDALLRYAEHGKTVLAKIDPEDKSKAAAYFTRLHTTLRVLRTIVATELSGQPLSELQKKWLSMVVEIVVNNSASGAPPSYAGWYFDLFRSFGDATSRPELITPLAQNAETVFYAGVAPPRIGVFVIDTNGPPRVVVGPIAHAYETAAPTSSGRLTHLPDEPHPPISEPWAASYTIKDTAPAPDIEVTEEWDPSWSYDEVNPKPRPIWMAATASSSVGPVTIQVLDHHRVPIETRTLPVGSGKTLFKFRATTATAEMLHLQIGTFHAWSQRGADSGFGFWLKRPD